MDTKNEILYLHGLESGPTGKKGSWLLEHYGAKAVNLNTHHARGSRIAAMAAGVPWDHTWAKIEEDFRIPLERSRKAIGPETRLIVGSSFGAAVLTRLLMEESWSGPCLLIAGAGLKLTGTETLALPPTVSAILLHGTKDTVIPIEDSRRIAQESGDNVVLWEIDDNHRMTTILESGMFKKAVDLLLGETPGSESPRS